MVIKILLKTVLIIALYAGALAVLGDRFGPIEITAWTLLLLLTVWLAVRRDIKGRRHGEALSSRQ